MRKYHLNNEHYVQVKQMLSMRQVANYYGFQEDRRHLCTCPFHKDKHPSMRIYPNDKGFYCFSCQKGGDVITFVSALYGIGNEAACKKLINDFSLLITTEPTTYREKREWEKRRKHQLEIQKFQKESIDILKQYWILLCEAIRDPYNRHFAEAFQKMSIIEYQIQCLEDDPEEYYKDRKGVRNIGKIRDRITGWNDRDCTGSAVP